MSRQANPMAVGGFVIGAIILVIAAVLVFGTGRLFESAIKTVAFFPGAVRGLAVGAPVEFQGVRIGSVTDIRALFNQDNLETAVGVYMDIVPDSVSRMGTAERDTAHELPRLIEKGLRARLDIQSFVTGQLIVSLNYAPEHPIRLRALDERYFEIPTVESTMDKLGRMLENVDLNELSSKAIAALDAFTVLASNPELEVVIHEASVAMKDLDKLLLNADDLVLNLNARVTTVADQLQGTLADAQTLARDVDSKVEPLSSSAIGAMDQGKSTLATAEGMISEDATTRQNLDMALEELAAAARSVRVLADYLQQNPDALLKGKGY